MPHHKHAWKELPASAAQVRVLRSIRPDVSEDRLWRLTRGEASSFIALCRKQQKRVPVNAELA